MREPDTSPWLCLENLHSLSQVTAVWRGELGAHLDGFRAAFLQRGPASATLFPCPRDCGCAHEIIRHAPDDLVAVCRCERWNCDDLRLEPEDIVCWELSWSRLGRALCQALGLDRRPADLHLPDARQIGSWSAAAVPVILAIPPEAGRFRQVVLELGSRLHSPFILLAPTARHLTAPVLELLAHVKAGFFDLASCVDLLPNGSLQPAKAPGELFMRFTPPPPTEDQSVLQRAFALAKALDAERPLRQPSPVAVFAAYCLEGLNVSQIARKFGCSRGTVLNRLDLIRQKTGMAPDSLRKISPQIGALEDQMSDPRAARIYRKDMIGEEGEDDA